MPVLDSDPPKLPTIRRGSQLALPASISEETGGGYIAGWDFRSGSGAKVVCEPNTCPEDGGGQPPSPSLPMIASYTWVTPCPSDELFPRVALENRGGHYCNSIRFGKSLEQSGKLRGHLGAKLESHQIAQCGNRALLPTLLPTLPGTTPRSTA